MQLENVQPRSQNMDVRSPVATAQAGDQYERYEPSAEFPAYVPRFAKPRDYASSGEWPTISVIIPTLNEVQNLPLVLAELPADIFEIIVVDGHSTDGTVETARRVCPRVNIVLQTGKGKGDALRCGFEAARGDIIVMLDADGSADPAEIADFVEVLLAGADFAKGTRFRTGGGSADITPLRRLGNHGLSKTVNFSSELVTPISATATTPSGVIVSPSSTSTARGLRSRPSSIFASGGQVWTCARCRASSASESTARATCAHSETGVGFSAR